ncbi:MAG: hypothetical protein IKJ35_02050 [Clostridia bacterium]|nr:hypothetical protein [Clostridia bacterium]
MFWTVNLVFLLFYALLYYQFRRGLYCAYPISEKKKRIGFKNYWWFESHFQNGAIHKAYYVNKIFFLAWCAVTVMTLLLGFVPFMQPVIMVLIGTLGIFLDPMFLWGTMKENQKIYGTAFVIWARRKHIRGFDSFVYDLLICLSPLVFVLIDLSLLGII